jgi:hypothetical protein
MARKSTTDTTWMKEAEETLERDKTRYGIARPGSSNRQGGRVVCSENLVRIDLLTESPHVGDDGRADNPVLEPGRVAL